jgi:hypothetical protein
MYYMGRTISESPGETFIGDSVETDFVLTYTPTGTNYVFVTVDGLTQTPVDSYSIVVDTVTFTEAPPDGSVILVRKLVV